MKFKKKYYKQVTDIWYQFSKVPLYHLPQEF